MNRNWNLCGIAMLLTLAVSGISCVNQPAANSNIAVSTITPAPSPSATESPSSSAPDAQVVSTTLPVIDAFFASDEAFSSELKTKLSLTDDQIARLRTVAREETSRLRETETGDYTGTTADARELADKRVKEIIGPRRHLKLAALVNDRLLRARVCLMKRILKRQRVPEPIVLQRLRILCRPILVW